MKKSQLLIIIIALISDQISKILITSFLTEGASLKLIGNFFYLTNHFNYGASWGILENSTKLIIVISVLALIVILRYSNSFQKNKKNFIAFSLLIGGICGNLADRLFFGYVRDFLDFRIFSYDFPIFNLADSFIVIGVILLIIAIIKGEDQNGSSSKKLRKKRTN